MRLSRLRPSHDRFAQHVFLCQRRPPHSSHRVVRTSRRKFASTGRVEDWVEQSLVTTRRSLGCACTCAGLPRGRFPRRLSAESVLWLFLLSSAAVISPLARLPHVARHALTSLCVSRSSHSRNGRDAGQREIIDACSKGSSLYEQRRRVSSRFSSRALTCVTATPRTTHATARAQRRARPKTVGLRLASPSISTKKSRLRNRWQPWSRRQVGRSLRGHRPRP